MEQHNKLQKTSDNNIELSSKEKEIASYVYQVNLLSPFPLNSIQIVDWSKSINMLLPDLRIEMLKTLMDDFKQDKIEWDQHKGIQNIFSGLKSYERKMVY